MINNDLIFMLVDKGLDIYFTDFGRKFIIKCENNEYELEKKMLKQVKRYKKDLHGALIIWIL